MTELVPAPDSQDLLQQIAHLTAEERGHLMARLARRGATGESAPPVPLVSYQQRNFWILHQLAAHPAAYNALLPIRLTGPIHAEVLRQAFSAVVQAYPIYRTVYHEDEGTLTATVRDDLEPTCSFHAWDGTSRTAPDAFRQLQDDALRPFALDAECPLRAHLYRLGEHDHLLGVVFHHIANDGASINLFWTALQRAYDAIAAGRPVPPPPLDTQYDRFAARQAVRTTAPSQEDSLRYWIEQLRGAPPAIDFLYDAPGGQHAASTDCEVLVPLGHLEGDVATFARAEATTPNVVYLAAYFAWLFRTAGATDAVVGVPIDERARRADRGVIGCCINMLSVRLQVTSSLSFRDLVRQTHKVLAEGIRHADVPFLRLVEEIQHEHRGAFGVYNTTFQYRNFIAPFGPLAGCVAEVEASPRSLSQFPLMLEVYPAQGVPRVGLTYDTHRFRRATAERLVKRYRTLLSNALRSPDRPLSKLEVMDSEERRLVEDDWPVNRAPQPPATTVPALFAEQVRRRPDAVALVWGDRQMTYRELDEASSRVAAALRRSGAGPGERIGVCMERSPDLIVALLAVLKSGAAYVPLDAEYPASRLRFMVADADVRAVVTDVGGLSRVRSLGATALTIEALRGGEHPRSPLPGEDATERLSPDAPAYVMYTSGSTGRPKGVLIPHRGITRLVAAPDYVEIGEDDVFLQLSSPSFDAATFEIWGPLLNGGRLALLPPVAPAIRDIGEAIRAYGVTTLWLTAGLFHLVVDEDVQVLQPLRQLLAGGDVLSPSHVRACLEACPGLTVINGYGPTENTTFSCCYPVPRGADLADTVPIGRPIAGSEAYVLDAHLAPTPIGVPGELYLGGAGLALGYWNRPELTEERFVPHPFARGPGATLYRTGDLARFRPDGTLEFLGRRDHQVKVRGFRVELGEVEAALSACESVSQCAVVVQPDRQVLTAYVVPVAGAAEVVDEARAHLRGSLPPYMIPSEWVPLDALPLTPQGKVDRRALPSPLLASPAGSAVDRGGEPQTPLEGQLLEIWRRLFHSDAITCTDDFFDLGGNSLLAIRFISEAERRLDMPVALTMLFQQPTIRELARVLAGEAASTAPSSLVPLASVGDHTPLFILHGWGGDVFAFRELARHLEGDHPVIGVQAVEHTGRHEPLRSIEAIASHYLAEIRSHQPSGPYFLMGYSLGGMIAYEVARQLRQAGESIGQLFVLDTHPPNLPSRVHLRALAPHLRQRSRHHASVLLRQPRHAVGYLSERARSLRRHVGRPTEGVPPPPRTAQDVPSGSDYYQVLTRHYVPQPCPMPVTVFEAGAREYLYDLRVAWHHLSGGPPDVVPVSARHLELLTGEPSARIAAVVRDRLARAPRGGTL